MLTSKLQRAPVNRPQIKMLAFTCFNYLFLSYCCVWFSDVDVNNKLDEMNICRLVADWWIELAVRSVCWTYIRQGAPLHRLLIIRPAFYYVLIYQQINGLIYTIWHQPHIFSIRNNMLSCRYLNIGTILCWHEFYLVVIIFCWHKLVTMYLNIWTRYTFVVLNCTKISL